MICVISGPYDIVVIKILPENAFWGLWRLYTRYSEKKRAHKRESSEIGLKTINNM